MIVTNAYKYLISRCKLEHDCDDTKVTRRGFTLIELVLVLMILAILAGSAMSMVSTQVDQARFESTQQTLQAIDRAVLGPKHARAADGSRSVSGFVADCGRLPYSLEELYIRPTSAFVPPFQSGNPTGDAEVTVSGGWNGPYVQPAIGATSLPDGWASGLGLYNSEGDLADSDDGLGILRSLGRDQAVGGTNYDADLSLIFESGNGAVTAGLATQEENRWQKTLIVHVFYDDPDDESYTNPDPINGDKIVVRLYGPTLDDSGDVILGTIAQEMTPESYSPDAPVTLTFAAEPIGPRIIRAYQLDGGDTPETKEDPFGDDTVNAVSVPTRVVISRETSSLQLILRDTTP